MSQQSTVLNTHYEDRVIDGSAIPKNITLNNCLDVHVGPKYVVNNRITINNEINHVNSKDLSEGDVLGNSYCSVIYKCFKIPCGVHLKVITCGSSFLLMVLIVIILIIIMMHTSAVRLGVPFEERSEDYPLDKRFVLREKWGAAPPCEELENNTLPLERAIFIHTVSSGTCNNFASCKQQVLAIQDMLMNECDSPTLGDIGYNFVIGSDGHIFVGRGWDKIGAHTKGSNTGSIGVAFIGDFRRDEPSPAMLKSAQALLEVGVKRSKLKEDYQLFGHCQVHSGFPYSPGVNMLRKIEFWPHWNDTNANQCSNFKPFDNGL